MNAKQFSEEGLGPESNKNNIKNQDIQSLNYPSNNELILDKGIFRIHIRPGEAVLWKDFIKYAPPNSIALDGYVSGQPNWGKDANGYYFNFDHHQEVNRLATRATCGQVFLAIKQGLIDEIINKWPKFDSNVSFQNNIHIFINDIDQDVALAVWLLVNYQQIERTQVNRLITELVSIEDHMDCSAGMYRFNPRSTLMQKVAWIFEPYTKVRQSGNISLVDAKQQGDILNEVLARISQFVGNNSDRKKLDTRFKILGGGKNWKLVKELGFYSRSAMLNKGIKAFVSVKQRSDGRYVYSIGKVAEWVDFPIIELYEVLNKAEGISLDDADSWGGSHLSGGSPRGKGSALSPRQVEKIINYYLATRN